MTDIHEAAIERAARMMTDLETRLTTSIAVLTPIVRGSDPDSPDGREAREMLARFTRMRDGLAQGTEEAS